MPLRACRALSARSRPSGATAPALAPALAGARATGARALSTRSRPSTALTSHRGGVHGNVGPSMKAWRNRPLFRREGNWNFKTGREASELLIQEAKRRDGFKENYLESITSVLGSLAPVFDRMPKYAWIAKLLLEPERQLQFRVAWLDDSGNTRVNRGFRVQYSSALGPYEGALHFNHLVDSSFLKACAFDATVSHALSGAGAAVGGADFDPRNKSEAEIQRFCQSYMTELSKYIGPEHDSPGMGLGCGAQEIGYLYGQYKRTHSIFSSKGSGVLYGGSMPYPQAYGRAVVAFADRMLEDKGESLAGKRCLVSGSGKVALAVAARLLEVGAVPLTLSDSAGHVYEPDGLSAPKLEQIARIKSERGARIGRFIVASTTAKYSDPESMWTIPCDLAFACAMPGQVDAAAAEQLVAAGCAGVIEGAQAPCTAEAVQIFKQRGAAFAPYKATLACGGYLSGHQLERAPLASLEELDSRIAEATARIFNEIKSTANEFNARGDLRVGADIAGFLRVGNVMLSHGAV